MAPLPRLPAFWPAGLPASSAALQSPPPPGSSLPLPPPGGSGYWARTRLRTSRFHSGAGGLGQAKTNSAPAPQLQSSGEESSASSSTNSSSSLNWRGGGWARTPEFGSGSLAPACCRIFEAELESESEL